MIVFTKIHDGQVSDERRIIVFKIQRSIFAIARIISEISKTMAKIVDDFIKEVILCVRFFEQNV